LHFLSISESESHRFDLKICRGGHVGVADIDRLEAEILELRPDVVILRMNAVAAADLMRPLAKKYPVIHADNLIEFRKNLSPETQADFLDSGAVITEVKEGNPEIDELIERCYAEYTNHYHANDRLDHSRILPGLIEFSRGFAGREHRTLLIARYRGKAAGYLCMEIKDGFGSSVIGGSALDMPKALRHRMLCDMTHAGDAWLMERGVKRFRAVTRTDKIYIQKLLIRNMHCLPAEAISTLHLNLFLSVAP
jgi:hypothetical protein